MVLVGPVELGPVGMVELRERQPEDRSLGTKDSSVVVGSSKPDPRGLGGIRVAGELRKHDAA